jgi:hypothetical protein
MRSSVDPQKIEQLMEALGKEARGPGCIYFTGGTSALLIGWRGSTVDVDIRLDPEPSGIFQALAEPTGGNCQAKARIEYQYRTCLPTGLLAVSSRLARSKCVHW